MITVTDARATARDRLRRRLADWAAGGARDPALTIALKPPREREMLDDEASAERWARDWRAIAAEDRAGVDVELRTRSWRSIGRQEVPTRVRFTTPAAVATFVGGDVARTWHHLDARAGVVRDRFGATAAVAAVIRRFAVELLRLGDVEFTTIIEVAAWLAERDVVGLRPRQLPLRGVDSKWFRDHRSIVTALHAVAAGDVDLGIVEADPLIRMRALDPALAPGGLTEFAAPASQLARLTIAPRTVFVFENLESVLAMPPWPDAVVVHGSGYAVDVVGRLPWVGASPILYWGDLDSNGFAILHRLRGTHDRVRSVLMDEATLSAHRDLWVTEPSPNRGTFDSLTGTEARALQRLRDEGDVRLEQERIPWAVAVDALRAADD